MSAFIERFSTIFDRILFGSEQQLKERDLRTLIEKHPFSKYLNYSTYDHNLGIYINSDCGLGMLWECAPLTFASAKTITTLEGVFRAGLPKGSVMQFILYADPHIDPMLQRYSQCRVLKDPIVQASTQKIIAFISKGRRGLGACADIPVRNFRLFVAVTIQRLCQPGENGLPAGYAAADHRNAQGSSSSPAQHAAGTADRVATPLVQRLSRRVPRTKYGGIQRSRSPQ